MINMISTTTVDAFPKSGFAANDSPEYDPYTDLFAALFSFPVAPPPTDLVKVEMPAKTGGETADLFFLQEGPETSLMPVTKPFADGVADILGLFPPLSDPKAKLTELKTDFDPIEPLGTQKPISFLGPPVEANPGKKPETPPIGPNDRLPIPPVEVCGMPVDGKLPPVQVRVPKETIIQHVAGKIDRRKEEHDHPVEFEILEIPADVIPKVTKSESDAVLEVPPSAPSNELVQANDQVRTNDQILANNVMTAAAPMSLSRPHPLEPEPKIWTRDLKEHRIDKKSEVSLLETFTNNVITDNAPAEAVRSTAATKSLWEGAETFAELSKPQEEKPQSEMATEFSFDSSLSGGPVAGKVEDQSLSDVKAKRMILDQVGSNLTDLALLQKDGGDNRVLKIRLKPAELGTVEITLSKNANGVIDAHFRTDNPNTQHLLTETLAQLRDSLESSGMKVGNLETSCTTSFSGSSDGGEKERRTFVTPDEPQIASTQFGGAPKINDDSKLSRLVNLRA